MEKPGLFAIKVKHQFIKDMNITHSGLSKPTQFFVVITCDIIDLSPFGSQGDNFLYHQQMSLGKVPFSKLPDIKNISIENQFNRFSFGDFLYMI